MAGESADEVARRAREKAERLLRHAEAYEKGAAGERAVQEVLAVLPPEWTVFHDVHWPGRPKANIDHVVIGPGGVFVIDTKNWSGTITVRDGLLRQNGYSRDAAVDGARAGARAVAGLVPSLSLGAFVPVLCFVGDGGVETNVRGVIACRATSLITMLVSRPAVLSPEWLDYLRFELDMSTRAATGPHVDDLALPVRALPAYTHRPTAAPPQPRNPRLLRRVALGLLAWWVACEVAFLTVGRATDGRPGLLLPLYVAMGLCAAVLVGRTKG